MQNLSASFFHHSLQFKTPAKTSRDTLRVKDTWYLKVWFKDLPEITGIGECAPLWGLSIENPSEYEKHLKELCENLTRGNNFNLTDLPSISFGLETALADLLTGGRQKMFDTPFSQGEKGITINGLVWMGSLEFMRQQLQNKIEAGFACVKLKIGAMDWQQERRLIEEVRTESGDEIELRVDANGAFNEGNVYAVLEELANLGIHSIEQPVPAGNWQLMAEICERSPIPIALDEELIGVNEFAKKVDLLDQISPQYLILKPSLLGGMASSDEWITLAENRKIGWWATSALESNVGLNAIAQWISNKDISMPQGLGTGGLFTNNIPCPLKIVSDELIFDSSVAWDFSSLKF